MSRIHFISCMFHSIFALCSHVTNGTSQLTIRANFIKFVFIYLMRIEEVTICII